MHWPGVSREKAIRPGPDRAGDEEVEPGDLALDAAGQLLQLDLDAGLLPEQHVMLVHHADVAEVDLELGHELPADVVGDAGEGLVLDVRRNRLGDVHRFLLGQRAQGCAQRNPGDGRAPARLSPS